jgi:hypothetical protein
MIPELPQWKVEELRKRLAALRLQIVAMVDEYQKTLGELRRDGYYDEEWIVINPGPDIMETYGSELYAWPSLPDGPDVGRVRYVAEPHTPRARAVWRKISDHFGQPPTALRWDIARGWVAEYSRPGRVSLFVTEDLDQIY